MKTKSTELIKTEEDWNKEVKVWIEHKKWVEDNFLSEEPQEPLKKTYKAWADPYRLKFELTKGGWGAAIVRELYIV